MVMETWLMASGVVVMTMIILDGKRKKKRHRAPGEDSPQRAGAVHDHESVPASTPDQARHAPVADAAFENRQNGSHLGAATQIHGDITADERVSIKGRVVGTVTARHQTIQLASSSVVNASLEGADIVVAGHLEGDINASEGLTLMSGAKVRGTISTSSFACHAGASVNGSVLPGQGGSVVFPEQKPAE